MIGDSYSLLFTFYLSPPVTLSTDWIRNPVLAL